MIVYVIRGMNGEPFYSIIAALQCVQPYSSNMISEGRERIIGTLIGAFWGSVILFAELLPVGGSFRTTVIFYLLLGIFSGLVIYSTVLIGIPQYALFSAVVFLGIAMYHVVSTFTTGRLKPLSVLALRSSLIPFIFQEFTTGRRSLFPVLILSCSAKTASYPRLPK